MKRKKNQIETISDLIEALEKIQNKFGNELLVKVWDSNYNACYDEDETQSIVNMIVDNADKYFYFDDEDSTENENCLIIKTNYI